MQIIYFSKTMVPVVLAVIFIIMDIPVSLLKLFQNI